MEITISDTRIVERLQQLADQLNQTPEQVVANALEQFSPISQDDEKAFWNSIRGIADSGDPDLAYHVKDILREEIDPIRSSFPRQRCQKQATLLAHDWGIQPYVSL